MPNRRQENSNRNVLDVMPLVNKILSTDPNLQERIIEDYGVLRKVCVVLKSMGKRIVMTKGVYDLLHVGHLRYIAAAKAKGDILVVSVDSDELTRQRKGHTSKNRPIVNMQERIEMLLHSRYVDIITVRDVDQWGKEDDTFAVCPDTLIKSQSTADDPDGINKVIQDAGIEIVTLQPQAQTSTTARIRTLMIDGAEELGRSVNKAVDDYLSQLRG
jgi:cytidyltransferase-like protein